MSSHKILVVALALAAASFSSAQEMINLLRNADFDFHCFENSRYGRAASFSSGYVACWNAEAYGDITVTSTPHCAGLQPAVFVRNIVAIHPGKHLYQIVFLPDVGLRHGDVVSLAVWGQQQASGSLRASVTALAIDSAPGRWRPADYGMQDSREFPRQARGELVKAHTYAATSGAAGNFRLVLEGCAIPGRFAHLSETKEEQINTIALQIQFENISREHDVLIYAPALVKGHTAPPSDAWPLIEARSKPTFYRQIPRTIRKLWRGEPLHILVMGSSIDRGSANPPLYLYDENPASPRYKQPVAESAFHGELIGRPELNGTVGRWQHYFAWAGRLRTELLRKFDYTPDKLLLNYMACDGSSISEAIFGLAEYASLRLPPDPELNGQPAGQGWAALYPGLFTRPQGPGPDLVLFGSGANEKTDQPDEGAVFEAAIRWLQQYYPDCEFVFCMWQRAREYTPNTGPLMELALNYGIPFIDVGDRFDQLLQCANRYALCPADGHPQAAGHYIWFKSLEEAFEVADPIAEGLPQRRLPRRLYPTAFGWEGEIVKYDAPHPRLVGNMMILDDTTINCWGTGEKIQAYVDGEKKRDCRPGPRRDLRNSLFAYGRLSLGDRHVLEIVGEKAQLTAADCKICPGRQAIPVDSPAWNLGEKKPAPFVSHWGAPFGQRQVRLQPREKISVWAAGTDLALAYVDEPAAGSLRVQIDEQAPILIRANLPYRDTTGREHYMEDRRGFRQLGYGLHRVVVEAVERPVAVLGLFAYDTRSGNEGRRLTGWASPGQTMHFTPAFRVRPVLFTHGGLRVSPERIRPDGVTFTGSGPGNFEAVGE